VYFLENIGFLTEKKYRSLKYLDIRVEDAKMAATNGNLQQPCVISIYLLSSPLDLEGSQGSVHL
jgi:hypothetical protein